MNAAIDGAIKRLNNNPPNNLTNATYRLNDARGWDDQWDHWDQLGSSDPGWGDVGDGPDQPGPDR
ncbi:MAG: hypothetical protein AAB607_00160 [Patescibacteria group bacterium]